MRSVGIKVLKNKLSEYVRLAAGGETVLVTDGDRVVAELGPPRVTQNAQSADDFIAQGVREGWLTPAKTPGVIPPRKPVITFDELMKDLEGDRAD
jgi:antitoxin (DNA-binding transcriptional repressor) of toxin-antitoxin stability system